MAIKKEKTKKPKVGDINDVDSTTFLYSINTDRTPTDQIIYLMTVLSLNKMELIANEVYNKRNDFIDRKYKVADVTINGQPNYILSRLTEIRPQIEKYFSDYANSDEATVNKVYELSSCKYHIKEFLYQIGYGDTSYYQFETSYKIWFKDGRYRDDIPASSFIYSGKALKSFEEHRSIRGTFMKRLYEFIDLQLEKVKMLETQQVLKKDSKKLKKTSEESKKEEEILIKEKELLEVWLALKHAGFLNHLEKETEIANHRKAFFESFNLIDRDYNDRHNNFKKKKQKKDYLYSLATLLEEAYSKKQSTTK